MYRHEGCKQALHQPSATYVNRAGRGAISFGLFNATNSMADFADPVASTKTDCAFAMTCGVIVKRLKGRIGTCNENDPPFTLLQ